MLKLFSRSKSIGNGSANGLGSTGSSNGRSSGEYHSSSPSSLSAFSQTAKRQRGTSSTSRKANEPTTRSSGSPLKSTASALQKIARQFSFTTSSSAPTTATSASFTITNYSYSPTTTSSKKNKGKGKNGYGANSNNNRGGRSSAKDMSVSSASETADETSSATHSSSFSMEYSDDDGVVEYVHPVTSNSVVNSSSTYYTDVETAKLINDLGKDTADIVLKIVDEFLPKCMNCNITDLSSMSVTTLMLCGQCVPPISLSHYISRIIRNINHALSEKNDNIDSVGVRCLLIAVIYINRLQQNVKDFQMNVLNIHRLFLIAMTDALKVNEDEHPDNKYMALVGGLDCAQLNSIETTFCVKGGFDLIINFEELQEMYHRYHSESYVLSVPENQQTYPVRRVSWESKR